MLGSRRNHWATRFRWAKPRRPEEDPVTSAVPVVVASVFSVMAVVFAYGTWRLFVEGVELWDVTFAAILALAFGAAAVFIFDVAMSGV